MGGMGFFKQRYQQPSSTNYPINQIEIWRPWETNVNDETDNIVAEESCAHPCNFDICNAVFKLESERRRHEELQKHCRNVESCQFCEATFTRKDNLTRHIKMKHRAPQNPRCKYCNKKLSRRDAVQRHMTTCPRNPDKGQIQGFLVPHNSSWEREH
ncbi:PR domain zinc finger protein 5 [Folsomia candida]|nr:PR domain zinc finger protein 5 [Folsomia candida]